MSELRGFTPPRSALFDKRLHAFERSLVHHITRHGLIRCSVCGCGSELHLAIKKFLSHCDCDARFADNCRDEFLELGVEVVFGFRNPIDQSTRFASPALINSPVTSISNAALRKIFRESATPGVEQKQTDVYSANCESGCARRDREIAHRNQLAPCGRRDPLNAGILRAPATAGWSASYPNIERKAARNTRAKDGPHFLKIMSRRKKLCLQPQ